MIKIRTVLLTVLAAALLNILLLASVQAEIYKWVDDSGRVHYGDKPAVAMPNSQEVHVDLSKKGRMGVSESRLEKQKKLNEIFDEDRKRKNKEQAKAKKKKKKNASRCARYKDKMSRYQRAGYLYDLDKQGNRVVMSAEAREESTQRLQKRIKKYCK